MDHGVKALVVKRGEFGATLFTQDRFFVVPAYPVEWLRRRIRNHGMKFWLYASIYPQPPKP
jgi:hypothetical protein